MLFGKPRLKVMLPASMRALAETPEPPVAQPPGRLAEPGEMLENPLPPTAAPAEQPPVVARAEAAQTAPVPPTVEEAARATPPEQAEAGLAPGAMAAGEPKYSAIGQLTDALNATEPSGTKESLSLKERVADAWSATKTLWEKSLGKMRAVSETLKETGRGVRSVTDLDRRLGEFDYALQKSAAQSRDAGRAIERQLPNGTLRDATAIWIDAGGDEAAIRAALPNLPANTSGRVRRAVEMAGNLPAEGKQFAESLRQYFGIRGNDAVASDILDATLPDYFTHIWKSETNMPDALRGAIASGRVSDYFQFARARKISTLLAGIIQGKTPELDPAKVVPHYNCLLDRAIASRRLIREASELTARDGRPALAPTGIGSVVERGSSDE